nr:hypothetical protein [uncultured Niameybacter sp.]
MKRYRNVLLTVLVLNIIMSILKYTFGITLLKDSWGYILWLLLPILIILYPTKRRWFIIIGKILLGIITLLGVGCLYFLKIWINGDYGYIQSPNGTHKIIVKEYTTGFRPSGNIEIYERWGLLFKKDTGGRIRLYKNPFSLEGGIKFDGNTKYMIDYNLILEWLDEDTLHIYCMGRPDPIREQDIVEATLKWIK